MSYKIPDKSSFTKQEVTQLLDEAHHALHNELETLRKYSKKLADHIEKSQNAQLSAGADELDDAPPLSTDEEIQKQLVGHARDISLQLDKAIGTVMERAEKIEGLLNNYVFAGKSKIEAEIIAILEACNTHDITTQRIYTIRGLLGDKTVPKNYQKKQAGSQSLESGPSITNEGMSQEEIDKLLNS